MIDDNHIKLIINADDHGYYNCVTRWGGSFPSKYVMALAILTGKIRLKIIEQELNAQIERCLDSVGKLHFLNSHEHIHMLPAIYKLTLSAAKRFAIPFVRHTMPEWVGILGTGALLRNAIFQVLGTVSKTIEVPCRVSCIGVGRSGRFDSEYLRKLFVTLKPSNVYELMCHPGYFDPDKISDRRLVSYHAWDAEQALLTSSEFHKLCCDYSIRLTSYRELVH